MGSLSLPHGMASESSEDVSNTSYIVYQKRWKTPPISLAPSVEQCLLFKTFYQFMCLKHPKPGSHLWITNKHKHKTKHKTKHKRMIHAWSKHKRKHKKISISVIVTLLVSLCSVNIRETNANNSVVHSGALCPCVFYVFLCLSVHVCEHSFFMLVLVLVLISQVQLIRLTTIITLFRIIFRLCQFDYFVSKYAVNC